jgi:hypothetical protein
MNNSSVSCQPNFFTTEECNEWVKYTTSHPYYKLTDEKSSRGGFTIYFSELHDNDFHNEELNILKIFDLFKRIKHPDTNAYVFNTLVLESCSKEEYNGLAIDYHIDRSARICNPLCVTVIYIEVPENFKCGRLCLPGCDIKIKPEIGKMVVFDGDIIHGVEQIVSEAPSKRISLVLEQYKLDKHDLDNYEFHITTKLFKMYDRSVFAPT